MTDTRRIILASGSATRRQLLERTGLAIDIALPQLDEDEHKMKLGQLAPAKLARELAAAKALSVSRVQTQALVIGADQVLAFNGRCFGKPKSRNDARGQLELLRNSRHTLETAVCCAEAGGVSWSHGASAKLVMRDFSDAFLDSYLDRMGEDVASSVGGYKLEGLGIQLFSRVSGDYSAILGLPLLPLLEYLRLRGLAMT